MSVSEYPTVHNSHQSRFPSISGGPAVPRISSRRGQCHSVSFSQFDVYCDKVVQWSQWTAIRSNYFTVILPNKEKGACGSELSKCEDVILGVCLHSHGRISSMRWWLLCPWSVEPPLFNTIELSHKLLNVFSCADSLVDTEHCTALRCCLFSLLLNIVSRQEQVTVFSSHRYDYKTKVILNNNKGAGGRMNCSLDMRHRQTDHELLSWNWRIFFFHGQRVETNILPGKKTSEVTKISMKSGWTFKE